MARSAARLLDGNDLFDLAEREAKPSSLRDEPDDRERVISIHTVARGGAPRRRENARRLVQAQRLAADATPGGDLTDEQTVSCHDPELKPCPTGQGQEPYRVFAASARRKKLPSVTTLSPGLRPSMTCTSPPTGVPSLTWRSTNLLSSPSAGT